MRIVLALCCLTITGWGQGTQRIGLACESPFEFRAIAAAAPARTNYNGRRLVRVKQPRPPAGKIDWRELRTLTQLNDKEHHHEIVPAR